MLEYYKKLLGEIFRYFIVGGTAFLLDAGSLYLFNEFIFHDKYIYVSVFLAYTIGLVYNFTFSCWFVFENGFKKIKNKEVSSFIIFTIIGLIGLGLTELLMYVFVDLMTLYYVWAKIITGAIVVFWNYIARKIIIFK